MRAELRPIVEEQQRHPAVAAFLRRMESDDRLGRKSVSLLVANGEELVQRLGTAASCSGKARVEALRDAVRPYLQEANNTVDPTTGRTLREIWRYFRYSWSIPQVPTPGRQLLYLVRDAGHPSHPVMGIAALNNCPLEMGETRETFIGWHMKTIQARFAQAVAQGGDILENEVRWLEQQIATSLNEVDWTNLATPEQVTDPDEALIKRLTPRSGLCPPAGRNSWVLPISFSRRPPIPGSATRWASMPWPSVCCRSWSPKSGRATGLKRGALASRPPFCTTSAMACSATRSRTRWKCMPHATGWRKTPRWRRPSTTS